MTANRRLLAALLPLLLVPFLVACDPAPHPGASATTRATAGAPGQTVAVDLDSRPFQLHVPSSYDPSVKAPLIVALHGFTATAAMLESYFKLKAESDRKGFLYAMPDGTKNRDGDRFWNATDACCDFERTGVDDSAYLHRLIETVKATYAVDARRVYVVGHSNGAFMAYRMACEHATEVTAIVSLAGAATNDPGQCTPARPVSVLQIHGTADNTIRFDGQPGRYPSAANTLALWRRLDGCGDQTDTSAAPIDLDSRLSGAETTVTSYRTGCRDATRVELWTIKDGGHIPALTADFAPAIVTFLYAQDRQ